MPLILPVERPSMIGSSLFSTYRDQTLESEYFTLQTRKDGKPSREGHRAAYRIITKDENPCYIVAYGHSLEDVTENEWKYLTSYLSHVMPSKQDLQTSRIWITSHLTKTVLESPYMHVSDNISNQVGESARVLSMYCECQVTGDGAYVPYMSRNFSGEDQNNQSPQQKNQLSNQGDVTSPQASIHTDNNNNNNTLALYSVSDVPVDFMQQRSTPGSTYLTATDAPLEPVPMIGNTSEYTSARECCYPIVKEDTHVSYEYPVSAGDKHTEMIIDKVDLATPGTLYIGMPMRVFVSFFVLCVFIFAYIISMQKYNSLTYTVIACLPIFVLFAYSSSNSMISIETSGVTIKPSLKGSMLVNSISNHVYQLFDIKRSNKGTNVILYKPLGPTPMPKKITTSITTTNCSTHTAKPNFISSSYIAPKAYATTPQTTTAHYSSPIDQKPRTSTIQVQEDHYSKIENNLKHIKKIDMQDNSNNNTLHMVNQAKQAKLNLAENMTENNNVTENSTSTSLPCLKDLPAISNLQYPRPSTINTSGYAISAPGSAFEVRSSDYIKSGVKIPSEESFYEFCGADAFTSKGKIYHFSERGTLPLPPSLIRQIHNEQNPLDLCTKDTPLEELKINDTLPVSESVFEQLAMLMQPNDDFTVPPYMVIAFQGPTYAPSMFGGSFDGEGVTLLLFFALTAEKRELVRELAAQGHPAATLLRRFGDSDLISRKDTLKGRLKGIPKVLNLDEADLGYMMTTTISKYNAKPFMTGPVHQRWYTGVNYLEDNIDVHEYTYIARKIASQAVNNFKTMKIEMAFTLEGRCEEELPERTLGSLELGLIDITNCPDADMIYPIEKRQGVDITTLAKMYSEHKSK